MTSQIVFAIAIIAACGLGALLSILINGTESGKALPFLGILILSSLIPVLLMISQRLEGA